MNNYQLEEIVNKKLNSHLIKDITPNGLQIEGCKKIQKIFVGVSICQKLINIAIQKNAQAIIVHHGFFWNNTCQKILHHTRKRFKSILKNNINIYSWHLPLDIHKKLGNNVQIANKLNITIVDKIKDIVLIGKFQHPICSKDLYHLIKKQFQQIPVYFENKKNNIIKTIAWCSGRGQKFIQYTRNANIDAFLTGEASEDTIYYAHENNIHFFAAGHHATERYGIQALGKWIAKKYNLCVKFIDINNPI
ncbi:Nif3-like dinuclear metal center hexameric protein [Buchnera aphidicola]|uniref:Nif3-like dinuclear metal center hexameric protein n=1 Tax=Buchnera aphidicola TaxID=9 RepID=UPI0034647449